MKFSSEDPTQEVVGVYESDELIFFDIEVFPNLFLVCWKYAGEDKPCVSMINPKGSDIEHLLKSKLVGFNCRRYDNHMLYACWIGYTNAELYRLSYRIIGDSKSSYFREAYNISYTDVYDFSSKKQSLKKFEIELGIHHQELGLPWDEPVPEDKWPLVVSYCENDVKATEAVFNDRKEDFTARQILADLSGLSVNDTTQMHAAKIIFGSDPNPQDKFIYTDLSELFPGYTYTLGKSHYRGEEPGEGGYVYAEPGMYRNVALLDVASMHPASIELMEMFGPYTKKYSQLKAVRIAIKHKNYEAAKAMLNGTLARYLTSPESSVALSNALKIAINIVYGLTSAKFDNKFKDRRNIDNIVAKRGALFMIDLKHAVQERGYVVAHCKTDSIKIPNATKDIIDFVFEFGKKYGYTFEHEATFDSLCLVNDAVYIARYKDGKEAGKWTATGAQFAHPYVFKSLFSNEEVGFNDLCETKSVTTDMYLDMNEGREKDYHAYQYVGKVGLFVPVVSGSGGGELLRKSDNKYYAISGTKGYRWLESEMVQELKKQDCVDLGYYDELVRKAVDTILKFGDFKTFIEPPTN